MEFLGTGREWLGLEDSFLITAGDIQLLLKILETAKNHTTRSSDVEMDAIVDAFDIQQVFT